MSLDSNTTELNEILDMANNLPEAGGESVQEIVYVDAVFDLATFSIVSVNKTYAEIISMIEAGKYVVMRGTYAVVSEPVNVAYFPLAINGVENNFLVFSGLMDVELAGTMTLISLFGYIFSDNCFRVSARIVSVTDLK